MTLHHDPRASRKSDSRIATILVLLSATFYFIGCRGDRSGTPPNVVMIVQDTARPDLLSAYGHPQPTSPFLESFAARGTRFDRAYSSSSWTLPAHGSLFTGLSPEIHQANQTFRRVAEALPLLPEQLLAAGFQTAGFSANMWMSELGGLARGFEHFENLNKGIYRPHVQALAADRTGALTPTKNHYVAERVHKWLREQRDPARPFFVFVNIVEPHLPYLPHWDAAKHFLPSREARWEAIQRYYPQANPGEILFRHYGRQEPLSAEEWDVLTRMYEGALRVADEITGDIVSAVDAVSDPDETLIFVLSDHGENLGDHGHLAHIFNLYDSNLRILCIARGPGFRAGAVEDRLVHITDLPVTVLRAAGIAPGPGVEGVDLRGNTPSDRVLLATLEYPRISLDVFPKHLTEVGPLDAYKVELRAAVGARYKLIRSIDPSGQIVAEEIYDLVNDPHETTPLDPAAVDPRILRRLRDALSTTYDVTAGKPALPLDGLEDEVVEGLRALGYVGGKEKDESKPRKPY